MLLFLFSLYCFSPIDTLLNFIKFFVNVPVLSENIYFICPSSSFNVLVCTFVVTFCLLSYISISHEIKKPWKYFTNSNVINRLIGTKLFNNTHQVPSLTNKKTIISISNKGDISLKNNFSIEKTLSLFFPKIFFKFSWDKIFLNLMEYSSKLKGLSSLSKYKYGAGSLPKDIIWIKLNKLAAKPKRIWNEKIYFICWFILFSMEDVLALAPGEFCIILVFFPAYTTKHNTDSVWRKEQPLKRKLLLSTITVLSSGKWDKVDIDISSSVFFLLV